MKITDAAEKRRFINFLRGFAIFLMLWGHVIQFCTGGQFVFQNTWGYRVIYSFHMPLFMLISGYLFFASAQKRTGFELIEYKTKSLLYPILMCSLLNLLLTNGVVAIARRSAASLWGAIPLNSLWFLWSVLACSLAVSVALLFKRKKVFYILFLVIGIGFCAMLPCWEENIFMYPYFLIGYFFAAYEEKFQKAMRVICPICLLAFAAMIPFFRREHLIFSSGLFGGKNLMDSLKIDLFRWGIGLAGAIAAAWLLRLLWSVCSTKNAKILSGVEQLGQNSLAVYALSVSLLSYWLSIAANKLYAMLPAVNFKGILAVYTLVITPLISIAYSFLFLLLIRLMKKTGLYRLIFGR